jgi:hypothetical protein
VSELEHELRALGAELAYPATPDLVPAVRERVESAPAAKRRAWRPARRTLVLALALLLLLAAAAFAASSGLRHTVLDWLGLRSVRVERMQTLPVLPPGRVAGDLGLGRRVTLAEARAGASFGVLIPANRPDEVYLTGARPADRVTLAYRARPGLPRAPGTRVGLLLTELRGRQDQTLLDKSLGPGTTATRVRVGDDPGIWIAGNPHVFAFVDAGGRVRGEDLRLAGNTLVWRRGGLLLRLEAHVSKARALRIARTLH